MEIECNIFVVQISLPGSYFLNCFAVYFIQSFGQNKAAKKGRQPLENSRAIFSAWQSNKISFIFTFRLVFFFLKIKEEEKNRQTGNEPINEILFIFLLFSFSVLMLWQADWSSWNCRKRRQFCMRLKKMTMYKTDLFH